MSESTIPISSKEIVHTLQEKLKALGHEVSLGHCYESLAALQGFQSWNVAKTQEPPQLVTSAKTEPRKKKAGNKPKWATRLLAKLKTARDVHDSGIDGIDLSQPLWDQIGGWADRPWGVMQSAPGTEITLNSREGLCAMVADGNMDNSKYFMDGGAIYMDKEQALATAHVLNTYPALLDFTQKLLVEVSAQAPEILNATDPNRQTVQQLGEFLVGDIKKVKFWQIKSRYYGNSRKEDAALADL